LPGSLNREVGAIDWKHHQGEGSSEFTWELGVEIGVDPAGRRRYRHRVEPDGIGLINQGGTAECLIAFVPRGWKLFYFLPGRMVYYAGTPAWDQK